MDKYVFKATSVHRIIIAAYIIAALLLAGSAYTAERDFQVVTPNGTGYGYAEPGGFSYYSAPDPSPTTQPFQAIPPANSNHYFGYQYGDTTIIVNPGGSGSSFVYGLPSK
jgi:hypothetical protein